MAAEILPFLLIGLIVAFAGLWPAARLGAAGASRSVVVAYYGILVGLALAFFVVRGAARILVPALVIAYVVPFIVASVRRSARR